MTGFISFDHNIQFTYESNKASTAFLDLDVALCNGRLGSTGHVTPIDRHQYLHYSLSYAEHM